MSKLRSEVAYMKEQLKDADVRFADKDAEVRLLAKSGACSGYTGRLLFGAGSPVVAPGKGLCTKALVAVCHCV